jgi:AAA domain
MHSLDACPPPAPSSDTPPVLLWGLAGLETAAGPADVRWLVHGYLAEGAVTLLTSQWKTGKTTLVSVLLARMKAGGQMAGLAVAAGKAIIICEEPAVLWELRGRKLDLEEHVGWFCRPFRGRPSPEQWQDLLDRVADEAAQRGVRVVVIDTLAKFFCGKSENDAAAMLAALASLQTLTARGLAVLVLHHPAKKDAGPGPSGRGSGALLGGADILAELRWYRRAGADDRRRRLVALSRFEETPRQLVIELNAAGTDYLSHGSLAEADFAGSWQVLHDLLRPADRKLTRAQPLGLWPDEEPPEATTLYRWLRRAVAAGLRQDGRGKGREPVRYWLPEAEQRWRKDLLAWLEMPELLSPPRPQPYHGRAEHRLWNG